MFFFLENKGETTEKNTEQSLTEMKPSCQISVTFEQTKKMTKKPGGYSCLEALQWTLSTLL